MKIILCKYCDYYTSKNDVKGICKRYPPKVFIFPPTNRTTNDSLKITEYPDVKAWDFCGEWRRKQ